MNQQLDTFETRLLSELRDHVGSSSQAVDNAPTSRSRRPYRWLAMAAAAIAIAVTATLLPGIGSSPAYSIGEGNPGEIIIDIERPRDASGLEAALQQRGIAADITYLPELQQCAPGRYTAATRDTDISVSVGDSSIGVTLAPGSVRADETLVLVWSTKPMTDAELAEFNDPDAIATEGFHSSVELDVATGPVGSCNPIGSN